MKWGEAFLQSSFQHDRHDTEFKGYSNKSYALNGRKLYSNLHLFSLAATLTKPFGALNIICLFRVCRPRAQVIN